MSGWWERFKEGGKHPVQEVKKVVKEHELHETYVVVEPDTSLSQLVAIQWWLEDEGLYTKGDMPVAQILGLAKSQGSACILIKKGGEVDYCGGDKYPGYRKATFNLGLRVVNYEVGPKTVEVLGKHYDINELSEALSKLEAK